MNVALVAGDKFITWLSQGLGIDPRRVQRVVIDAVANETVHIYVEQWGMEEMIQVAPQEVFRGAAVQIVNQEPSRQAVVDTAYGKWCLMDGYWMWLDQDKFAGEISLDRAREVLNLVLEEVGQTAKIRIPTKGDGTQPQPIASGGYHNSGY